VDLRPVRKLGDPVAVTGGIPDPPDGPAVGQSFSHPSTADLAQIDASVVRHMYSVSFHERRLVAVTTDGDRYHYRSLHCPTYTLGVWPPGFRLLHIPQVGDLVYLDAGVEAGSALSGTFKVVQRSWLYSAYGSTNWPQGEPVPRCPGNVDILVERAEGPFTNDDTPTEEDPDGP
jgi:hypothetical protein